MSAQKKKRREREQSYYYCEKIGHFSTNSGLNQETSTWIEDSTSEEMDEQEERDEE